MTVPPGAIAAAAERIRRPDALAIVAAAIKASLYAGAPTLDDDARYAAEAAVKALSDLLQGDQP